MIWKLIVALAAVFNGVQQPVAEPLVFNGIPLNIIPEQCPMRHFREQTLEAEIAQAQKALSDIPEAQKTCIDSVAFLDESLKTKKFMQCVQKRLKKYDKPTLQRTYNYLHAHSCEPQDGASYENRNTILAAMRGVWTPEETDYFKIQYLASKRFGHICDGGKFVWGMSKKTKKKLQQRARRMRNQERNQNAAAE